MHLIYIASQTGTSILVGGFLGCFLDHIIPGTKVERGIIAFAEEISFEQIDDDEEVSTYDWPVGMGLLRACKWTKYIPFLPTYKPPTKNQ